MLSTVSNAGEIQTSFEICSALTAPSVSGIASAVVMRVTQALIRQFRSYRQSYGTAAQALVYAEHGEPSTVLAVQERDVARAGPGQVTVEFLAAPINPADLNQIQGKYPIKPELPAVAGNEGVGRVIEAGDTVGNLKIGDHVVPLHAGAGTWRQKATFAADALHAVPADLPLEAAATMCINPPSAMQMLEEFVELSDGDVIVQNNANSAVGQLVIQLAKARGVRTVNVVRDRPNMEGLDQHLKQLGADVVTTDADLKEALAASGFAKPKLGLNSVGGASSTAIAKALRPGATMVTYGGMSLKPVTIPTSLFIFKDLICRGFWLSGGPRGKDDRHKRQLLDRVVPLLQSGSLSVRTKALPFEQFQKAFTDGFTASGEKVLLTFQ